MLVHAYTMYRKMKLIQAEKWFLIKDFGRSGKGLFMETFEELLKVNKVNFDSLLSSGFEAANEWLNFMAWILHMLMKQVKLIKV